MNTPLPTQLTALARLFQDAGFSLYAVGGMVRNPLLGYASADMDVCSAMRPDAVLALCRQHNIKTVETGAAFGMVELHFGGCKFEHTTFRADHYPEGGRHRPDSVRFSDTVQEDAFRRDFTVNALYREVLSGELIDPTGGMADLSARLLRATSPDPAAVLGDDALRILRLCRFAAELGFEIEESTLAAAKKYAPGLADISAERVRQELDKILLADIKYGTKDGVYRSLSLLGETGAMGVILPELCEGKGIKQKAQYHAYDVYEHSLHACAAAEPEHILRLSALLHDVGKPAALRQNGRMLGHDALGAKIAQDILLRLKYPNAAREEVTALIAHHMYDLTGLAKESTLRERFAEWGAGHTLRVAALREADVYGSGKQPRELPVLTAERFRRVLGEMQRQHAPFSEAELNVRGDELMAELGLPPSPEIGKLKRALLLHCARKPQDNTREKLLKIARDLVKNL